MDMRGIADQLVAWRLDRRLTQAALAERCGIPRPNISNIENGRCDPTLGTLRRLAAALDLGLGAFLEEAPSEKALGRIERDALARKTLGLAKGPRDSLSRSLERVLSSRRRVVRGSLSIRTADAGFPSTARTERKLKIILGDKNWMEILRRVEKLAGSHRISADSR